MAGNAGEEAIVEVHEESGETMLQNPTMTCDKGEKEVEGEELKEKIDRLRGLLEDERVMLINGDVDDIICYLDVDEIIRLALKPDKEILMLMSPANERLFDERGYYLRGGKFVPSSGKVLQLLELMLQSGVEKLQEGDLFILYQNFPKLGFAQLLSSALGSFSLLDNWGENVMICNLCCILPWKLFIHVMCQKTKLPQFKRIKEEEEEESKGECTIQENAAKNCEICCGKGKHSGVYGYYCSFWDCVPGGLTVGPSHFVCCRGCGCPVSNYNRFRGCWCGSRKLKAVPCSGGWKV